MHKNWTDRVELTKKTSHYKSRAFSPKTPTKNRILRSQFRANIFKYAYFILGHFWL